MPLSLLPSSNAGNSSFPQRFLIFLYVGIICSLAAAISNQTYRDDLSHAIRIDLLTTLM